MSAHPQPVSLADAFDALEFLPDRRPGDEADAEAAGGANWYDQVADYRDGAAFIVHYAGDSEWERHPGGDEVVLVVDGTTTMTMVVAEEDVALTLGTMEMIIVPQGVWHRFHTPDGAKIMTITPTPTEHRLDHPLA